MHFLGKGKFLGTGKGFGEMQKHDLGKGKGFGEMQKHALGKGNLLGKGAEAVQAPLIQG